MFKNLFETKKANKIAVKGLGPFIPSTLVSFLSGTCSHCGERISDFTLFGNAIEIKNKAVIIRCVKCRTGLENDNYKPEIINAHINKSRILIDLERRIKNKEVDWLTVVFALRLNLGFFQSENKYDTAYKTIKFFNTPKDNIYQDDPVYLLSEYIPLIQSYFKNPMKLKTCGECGASWNNKTIKDKKMNSKDFNSCWSCGIPNKYQWNMRTSFDIEENQLLDENI